MALKVPAERKSRRVMPSQVVTEALSVKVNMGAWGGLTQEYAASGKN
jgi:hypothetical protein